MIKLRDKRQIMDGISLGRVLFGLVSPYTLDDRRKLSAFLEMAVKRLIRKTQGVVGTIKV